MDLNKISTRELQAELQRREEEGRKAREEAQILAYKARIQRFEKLTPEMIDVFVPEHSRTSCSDENPCNGFSDNIPRCTRCALLSLLGSPWGLPFELDLSVFFEVK